MGKRIFWCDTELTGMTKGNQFLEIAAVVTDLAGEQLGERFRRVCTLTTPMTQITRVVRKMHTQNGLFDDCNGPLAMDERQALDDMVEYIKANAIGAYGGGVQFWFDRGHFQHHGINMDELLHPRDFDMASVDDIAMTATGTSIYPPMSSNHRAMDDVNRALAAYRVSLQTFRRGRPVGVDDLKHGVGK
jgi:oligoribonuclease (3'-5' exoribonuclease)